jgi:hypothetical protein
MRRKVVFPEMAAQRQARLLHLIVRIDDEVKKAAFGLCTLDYLVEGPADGIIRLFHSFSSITSVIPELQKLLQVEPPLFTEQQISCLDDAFSTVHDVLERTRSAIRAVDSSLRVLEDTPQSVKQFMPSLHLDSNEHALKVCFRKALLVVVRAKVAHLDRYGFL